MQQKGRILALLLSALLICVFIVPAAAAGLPDAAQKGSITVNLDTGGKMTLYQVAQYHADTRAFHATMYFEESGFDQDHLSADDAVAVWNFIQTLRDTPGALMGQTKKIDSGSVQFSGLPLGVYLLAHEGLKGYPEVLPFFVTIPMQGDGAYVYDVNATSKVRAAPPPTPTPTPPTPMPTETPESPAPSEPDPMDPEPTDPQPTDPQPTDPQPAEPNPDDPEPFPPEPVPSPSEPAPSSPGSTLDNLGSISSFPSVGFGNKLPNTGQLNWPIPLLVILGLILFGVGWYLHHHDDK